MLTITVAVLDTVEQGYEWEGPFLAQTQSAMMKASFTKEKLKMRETLQRAVSKKKTTINFLVWEM